MGRGGRPTKYKPEYIERVARLCGYGLTDEQIATELGVAVSTLYLWQEVHQEFSESIKRAKEDHDAQVEQSLRERALGYSHPEDDIRVCNNEIVITPTIKHYPPDPTSMIFWLKNRQPQKWRDKREAEIKVDGPVEFIVGRGYQQGDNSSKD